MRKFVRLCLHVVFLTGCLRRRGMLLRAGTQDTAKEPETPKAPEPPAHFYHLEFVIQELGNDGKPTNSRTYSTIVSTSRTDRNTSATVRTGSQVPIITGALHGPTGEAKETIAVSVSILDVGVSIDARDDVR